MQGGRVHNKKRVTETRDAIGKCSAKHSLAALPAGPQAAVAHARQNGAAVRWLHQMHPTQDSPTYDASCVLYQTIS
jgi:hypothetical protein